MPDNSLVVRLSVTGGQQVQAEISALVSRVQSVMAAASGATTALITAGVSGLLAAGAAIGAMVSESISFNAQMEQATISFKTLLGSMDAAKERMAALNKFAAASPFRFAEVVQANRLLETNTAGTLSGAVGMKLVGDAASAAAKPIEEVAFWIGRLFDELRSGNPTGRATLSLMEMGLITGNTRKQVEAFAESNHTNAETLTFLQDILKRTNGAMQEQGQTLNGLLSTLYDVAILNISEAFKFVFDAFKDGVRASIPLMETLGRAAVGVVELVRSSVREGNIMELIGLAIEAGFELGGIGARRVWSELVAFLGSGSLWQTVGQVVVTTLLQASEAIVHVFMSVVSAVDAVARYIMDALKYAFTSAANFLAEQLQRVMDGFQHALFSQFRVAIPSFTIPKFDSQDAPEFAKSWKKAAGDLGESQSLISRSFEMMTNSMRAAMGIGFIDKPDGAITRLAGMVKKAAELAESKQPSGNNFAQNEQPFTPGQNFKFKEFELQLTEKLTAAEEQRKAVEADFTTTAANKWQVRKAILEEEKKLLSDAAALLRERAKIEQDSAKRDSYLSKAAELEKQASSKGGDIKGMGANPYSYIQQLRAAVTGLYNEFGTLAQQVAHSFASIIGGSIHTLSHGLTNVIMGTQRLGAAMRDVGNAILTSIISAIIEMGAKWIVTHVLMQGISAAWFAIQKAFRTADTAHAIASETAKTPALATNATLASIGSWGIAVAIGIAAIAGILAATHAFADGGRPTPGQVALVGERGPELWVPDSHGTILSNSDTRAAFGARGTGSGASGGGHGQSVNAALFLDRNEFTKAMRTQMGMVAASVVEKKGQRFFKG